MKTVIESIIFSLIIKSQILIHYFLDEDCFLTYTNMKRRDNLSLQPDKGNLMHSIQVYIDEKLDEKSLNDLKLLMQGLPHVTNVEINASQPHDLLVEYEEHYNIPVLVMDKLHYRGLHPDIVSA